MTVAIPVALDKYISTRERRIAKAYGYERTHLRNEFSRVIRGETVRFGGRATCGNKVDPSWVEYSAWKEVIRKAASLGIKIECTPQKVGNGWATKAGGFWHEDDYRLICE